MAVIKVMVFKVIMMKSAPRASFLSAVTWARRVAWAAFYHSILCELLGGSGFILAHDLSLYAFGIG